jgi:hypothetical protein
LIGSPITIGSIDRLAAPARFTGISDWLGQYLVDKTGS